MTIDMKKYYVCQHCGEINYDISTAPHSSLELIYYSECRKCGKSTPWATKHEGTEFTEEEIINSIEYISNKAKKIKGKEVNWSDLPEKKRNVIRTLDVIGTLLDEALYGRFRVLIEKNISELTKQTY